MRATMARGRHQVEFSGFRLDIASRELFGPDDATLPLTSKALDVLAYLIEHSDRMVGKDERLAAVWTGRVVEENNLPQAISALRKAFGVGAGEHRFIVTIPGRGYRFVAQSTAGTLVDRRRAADATEPSAAAERLYLAGRDLIDAPSLSRCKRAIGVFRQVLDIDPRCARAWSGLAFAWRALTMTGDMDPKQAFPLAKAAVRHAFALNPDLPEAHASHGFNLFWNDWDWVGAELAMQRAISLGPNVPDGHFAYAHLLNNLGRFDEALAQARQARAGIELARGDPAAVATLQLAANVSGRSSQVLAALAPALVAIGNRAGAERLREELRTLSETAFVPAASRAAVSNALGEHDEALDLLELAIEQRDVRMTFLKIDARWNNLRGKPRFEALIGRLGFAAGTAGGTP